MSRSLPVRTRRDDTGRILVTRRGVARLGQRHIKHVKKLLTPVAYDIERHWSHAPSPLCTRCQASAAALVDLDEATELLAAREHRAPLEPQEWE